MEEAGAAAWHGRAAVGRACRPPTHPTPCPPSLLRSWGKFWGTDPACTVVYGATAPDTTPAVTDEAGCGQPP